MCIKCNNKPIIHNKQYMSTYPYWIGDVALPGISFLMVNESACTFCTNEGAIITMAAAAEILVVISYKSSYHKNVINSHT